MEIITRNPELQHHHHISDNIFQFLEHNSWKNILDQQKDDDKHDTAGKIILKSPRQKKHVKSNELISQKKTF